MCLNREDSIFKVILFSKIADGKIPSVSCTSSCLDFLKCGQAVEDMTVPGGDK